MSNEPLPLTLVELGVSTMNGLAAPKASHVDVERAAARRGSTENVRPLGVQLKGHGPISSIAEQQRLCRDERRQRAPPALVTHFRVRAQQGAAARIDAAQTGADGLGLHGHLTQSNRSARLIRPEM